MEIVFVIYYLYIIESLNILNSTYNNNEFTEHFLLK